MINKHKTVKRVKRNIKKHDIFSSEVDDIYLNLLDFANSEGIQLEQYHGDRCWETIIPQSKPILQSGKKIIPQLLDRMHKVPEVYL